MYSWPGISERSSSCASRQHFKRSWSFLSLSWRESLSVQKCSHTGDGLCNITYEATPLTAQTTFYKRSSRCVSWLLKSTGATTMPGHTGYGLWTPLFMATLSCWNRRFSWHVNGSAVTCQIAAASITGSTCCAVWEAFHCCLKSWLCVRSCVSRSLATKPSGCIGASASGICILLPPMGKHRPRRLAVPATGPKPKKPFCSECRVVASGRTS